MNFAIENQGSYQKCFEKYADLIVLAIEVFVYTNSLCRSQVEIRPMMYVALTYDHRLVDGREGTTFLRKIKAVVEDPRVLLFDM